MTPQHPADHSSVARLFADIAQNVSAVDRNEGCRRALYALEYLWENGYVVIRARDHLVGRAQLALISSFAAGTAGLLVGCTVIR